MLPTAALRARAQHDGYRFKALLYFDLPSYGQPPGCSSASARALMLHALDMFDVLAARNSLFPLIPSQALRVSTYGGNALMLRYEAYTQARG